MNRQPAILIFDIGKTAKKVLVFDRQFHVLEEQSETFSEISDEDGFPSEDLPRVVTWMKDNYRRYIGHPAYDITHCNVSGYGASLVNLDMEGAAMMPFYNYLKPFGTKSATWLASQYNVGEVCVDTASPYLGLLNSGLQLLWIKHERPDTFKRIANTLHLPQFFAGLLSDQYFTEITSVGCHTMLWDYRTHGYHEWVRREGLDKLFPAMVETTHTIPKTEASRTVQLGVGVHDSSAALMPYLATQKDPFLLLSTGTWNICFNPFSDHPLTKQELAADCLSYLTYQARPVKASRIFLGHEHEAQCHLLSQHFRVAPDHYKTIRIDEEILTRLSAADGPLRPFYPVGMEGSGPLPGKPEHSTDLTSFSSFAEAYHQMVRYLVQWQLLSIELIDPLGKIGNIIVVGGFTRSPIFLEALKRTATNRRVLISDHPRASALGAAWLVCGPDSYAGKEHLLSVAPY